MHDYEADRTRREQAFSLMRQVKVAIMERNPGRFQLRTLHDTTLPPDLRQWPVVGGR